MRDLTIPESGGRFGGYSVLDMMVVFAISTVCVVMGVPKFLDYSVRAKVVEALAESHYAKSLVTTVCAENPKLNPLDNKAAGLGFKPSVYVQEISIDGACIHPVVTIVTANTGATPDPVLTLDAIIDKSGRLSWTCLSDARESYLPSHCR